MKNLKNVVLTVTIVVLLNCFGYNYYSLNKNLQNMQAQHEIDVLTIDDLTETNATLVHRTKALEQETIDLKDQNAALEESLEQEKQRRSNIMSRGSGRTIDVECTAYTLGGNTATGDNLTGCSREDAMVIAVDPNVIPLGSNVRIMFHDANWSHYNGIYKASDVGGGIRGNIIDVFVGHGNNSEAFQFGRRTATVEIL